MKIKPRIKYVGSPYFFGILCNSYFHCASKECAGIGVTPKEAYDKWAEKLPKTSIGRFFARSFGEML